MTARLLLAVPVLAGLLQVTWMPELSVLGAFPNLALVAAVCWAWSRGTRAGLGWALVAGLVVDVAAPGPVGVHALALVCAVYAAGLVASAFGGGRFALPLAAALATVAYGAVVALVLDTLRLHGAAPAAAASATAGAAAWDALLAPVLILGVRWAEPRLNLAGSRPW